MVVESLEEEQKDAEQSIQDWEHRTNTKKMKDATNWKMSKVKELGEKHAKTTYNKRKEDDLKKEDLNMDTTKNKRRKFKCIEGWERRREWLLRGYNLMYPSHVGCPAG